MIAIALAKDRQVKAKLLSLAGSVLLYVALLFGMFTTLRDKKIDTPKEMKLLVELVEAKKEERVQEPQIEIPTPPQAAKKIESQKEFAKKAEVKKVVQKIANPLPKEVLSQSTEVKETVNPEQENTLSANEESRAKEVQTKSVPKETQESYTELNLAKIKEMIAKALRYPAVARKMKKEGSVLISFEITNDGAAQNIEIVRSSGVESLDSAAVSAIESAGSFPGSQDRVKILVPVEFNLKEG